MALPLGALLLGGGPAGRLCHPGTDQAPQGQGLRVAAPIDHGMPVQPGQGRVVYLIAADNSIAPKTG
jgi:hypothetical protein